MLQGLQTGACFVAVRNLKDGYRNLYSVEWLLLLGINTEKHIQRKRDCSLHAGSSFFTIIPSYICPHSLVEFHIALNHGKKSSCPEGFFDLQEKSTKFSVNEVSCKSKKSIRHVISSHQYRMDFCIYFLFISPDNTSLVQIVWGQLDRYFVSRKNTDKVHTQLSADMS